MKNITKKLFEIQKLGLTFTKNAENPFFHSKYLDLDKLNKGLMPTLNTKGMLLLHRTSDKCVVTEIIDVESGESISSLFPIPESIIDPQKMGSVITYAKRYNIGQLFNIITDKDDDAEMVRDGKVVEMQPNPKIKIEPKVELPIVKDGEPF